MDICFKLKITLKINNIFISKPSQSAFFNHILKNIYGDMAQNIYSYMVIFFRINMVQNIYGKPY